MEVCGKEGDAMNVKLLRKVKKHILEEPKRLMMGDWVTETKKSPCGTAACIGGWAVILSGKYRANMDAGDVQEEAKELLDVEGMESTRLFGPVWWPAKFRGGCADDGEEITAKIAAKRIDHFIKTEGRE